MKIIKGGITEPKGFKANGLCCGIKSSGKKDLGLIVSDVSAMSATMFTKNSVVAAPLVVSRKHARSGKIKAIIVNSGNANCFTGKFGLLYAEQTTEVIGGLLGVPKNEILVTSTGIIGKPLPFKKIEGASKKLVEGLSVDGQAKFATAILTTDLTTKEVAVTIVIGGKKVTIGGVAKGSGMIAPNMATMLGFITTDLNISSKMLKLALKYAVAHSFNSITVDGCMSTNDMVTVLANGFAKNDVIESANESYDLFKEALRYACVELSKMIVLDGEGATKFIEVNVKGALDHKQAQTIVLKVANDNLVKTAAYGCNPNWGRVAAAVGALGYKDITEENLKITFSSFEKKNIQINVELDLGKGHAQAFTSDLSKEYVRINAEYN